MYQGGILIERNSLRNDSPFQELQSFGMNINLTLQQNYRTQHLFVFQAIQSSFSIKLYSTIIGCFRHFDYRRTPVLLTLWLQSAFL